MNTLTKRKRARLALQLLGKQPPPRVGDNVLIWARIERISGPLKAVVVTSICPRGFVEQTVMVDRDDIALVTTERP